MVEKKIVDSYSESSRKNVVSLTIVGDRHAEVRFYLCQMHELCEAVEQQEQLVTYPDCNWKREKFKSDKYFKEIIKTKGYHKSGQLSLCSYELLVF